jgi:predicted unusual protein kinase regulating ubiquinone biosynthesis (AarF/ABC1/UbiB family)
MGCELLVTMHIKITLDFCAKCAAITLDYKWNFTPEKSDLIPELHERVADRMYNLFIANGGLYIKIGYVLVI